MHGYPTDLIYTGPSGRGNSRAGAFRRCPQAFAYEYLLGKHEIGEALVKGTMFHLVIAHYRAMAWKRYHNIADAVWNAWLPPDEALAAWLDWTRATSPEEGRMGRANHALIWRTFEAYTTYYHPEPFVAFSVPAGSPFGAPDHAIPAVELPVWVNLGEITLPEGHPRQVHAWLAQEGIDLPLPLVVLAMAPWRDLYLRAWGTRPRSLQWTTLRDAVMFGAEAVKGQGPFTEPIRLSQGVDLVSLTPSTGAVHWWDVKTTSSANRSHPYAAHLQFFSLRHFAEHLGWGPRGLTEVLIDRLVLDEESRAAGWKTQFRRVVHAGGANMQRRFPAIIRESEYGIARLEERVARGEWDPSCLPTAVAEERTCEGRYGACTHTDVCLAGM